MRTKGPCGPRSKKRKRLAPVGTPAVAEVRAAGDGDPLAGTSEETVDPISLVPDAVLGEIVYLLPTKEGARTQVLASRWRNIWRSTPLNLDCGGLTAQRKLDGGGQPAKDSDHDCVVSHILTSHEAPVRRLCIPMGHGCTEERVEAWLQSPALDNLQELEFCYVRDSGQTRECRLWGPSIFTSPPASTFRFAATLRLATIGKCHLPDSSVQGIHFPQLKHLALHWVSISEHSIHGLIAECPALECLLIYCISGPHCLRVNAARLRSIGVCRYQDCWTSGPWLDKLVIENAPCLERMLRLNIFDGLQASVISAPKLETLGFVKSDHRDYSWILKGLHADRLTTMSRLVKTLAIHMDVLDLDIVIDLMACFPCLENLYIQDEHVLLESSPKNLWRRKHRKLIGTLDMPLKTIVFETYEGNVSDVNFATFFLLNSRELESMTIQVARIDEQFISRQQRLLQLEKKASSGARVQFTTDRCLRDISDVFHVHDLDLTDPFRYRCRNWV